MLFQVPKCQVVPLPDSQASLQIDGRERLCWHFDAKYPRLFFYPFNGPSGETLTRMGHPGAPIHDHHRSVWWAHAKVDGENYWGGERRRASGRSCGWRTPMATSAGWSNGAGKEIMEQEMEEE